MILGNLFTLHFEGKKIGHSFCRFSSPHRRVPSLMQNFTTSYVAKEMLNADQ